MPAAASENSDVTQKNPQNLLSEGVATKTRQKEEGSSLPFKDCPCLYSGERHHIARLPAKVLTPNDTPTLLYCRAPEVRITADEDPTNRNVL